MSFNGNVDDVEGVVNDGEGYVDKASVYGDEDFDDGKELVADEGVDLS